MSEAAPRILKPVPPQLTEENLHRDLERYHRMALDLGAAGAAIVPASYTTIDERVRLKCFVPRCPRYGETPNCPPHTPSLSEVRAALSLYSWAIVVKSEIRSIIDYVPVHKDKPTRNRKTLDFHSETSKIVAEIEGAAYRDGYHLAAGFGGGSCKDYLCAGQICQFMDSGRCRFPLRARPAMEAMGIDVIELTKRLGWTIYPLSYAEQNPECIPFGVSVGMVFIC